MKKLGLLVVIIFISILSQAQDKPGVEITNGNSIFENESVSPENVGLLKLKLIDGEGLHSLHMDQYDIQSVSDGEFGGILYFQDQGGCVNIAKNGETSVGYLSADTISINGAQQTKASGQIAFGTVTAAGNKASGSSNWSVSYNSTSGEYEIVIENENYVYTAYSTQITSNSISNPRIPSTNSVGGKLLVKLFDFTGTASTGGFAFTVNKYQPGGYSGDCGGSGGPIGIFNSEEGNRRRASLK